jgi:outer membrane receptor protein involved in Fe transport
MLSLNVSRSRVMQRTPAAIALSCLLTLIGAVAGADAMRRVQFNIEAQSLSTALAQFSNQAGLQFTAPGAQLSDVKSTGVRGEYSTGDALGVLLEGTGFTYHFVDEATVAIQEVAKGNAKIAQAEGAAAGHDESNEQGARLEEIVVTAQKRVERLQDVPVPVTAISGASLIEGNHVQLRDYYTRVPGLNLIPSGFNGEPQLSIRGLATGGFENPVIGIVVDDVPIGSSRGEQLGTFAADFDPSDLSRIEVLRGPQGTLYGASSMGGLLKYVTVDPSTAAVSGRVQAGISDVSNGDGLGYNVRGSVNVPLSDTFAIRASGFSRRDPGYIDNPTRDESGINELNVYGGRLSGLWRPSDTLSLKLNAMYQKAKADGSSQLPLSGATVGTLNQSNPPGTGWYDKVLQAYSATLSAKLGVADLTAISGYTISDLTDFVVPFGPGFGLADRFKNSRFSQEVRASIPLGQKVEWLLGAFYSDEKTDPRSQQGWLIDPATGDILINPATGQVWGLVYQLNPDKVNEYAAFTTFDFHFTDRFDVQLGGRQSHGKITETDFILDPVSGAFLSSTGLRSTSDAFTYLFTPRFKISDNLMAYMRLASGFRSGGPNTLAAAVGNPLSYDPDKTKNYEIGIKGSALNRTLTFDASIYYIDWSDFQLRLACVTGCQNTYVANLGQAKSEGVELSVELRPVDRLRVSAWVAYNNAELTEGFPPQASGVFGRSGDRLPNGARRSGNIALDYDFPLLGTMTGQVGGSLTYVGDRAGSFRNGSTLPQPNFSSYTQVDVSAGIRKDTWSVNAFANNLTDRRALLSGDPTLFPNGTYIQPRTVGVSVAKDF